MRACSREGKKWMSDELIKQGAAQVSVNATDGGIAMGVNYGNILFEMTPEMLLALQQMTGIQEAASHAAEWALLSTEMFNVFVLEKEKYDCGAFSISRRLALQKNTPPQFREHYLELTPPLIAELLNLPCIFAVRNQDFKRALPNYPAVLGRLTEIICQGDVIKFRFVRCGQLRQQFINEHIREFGLLTSTVRNQLDEEHWSIREGNLLQIAEDFGIEIR